MKRKILRRACSACVGVLTCCAVASHAAVVINVDSGGPIADAGLFGEEDVPVATEFTITVSGLAAIADLDFRLAIGHPVVYDLDAFLTHPNLTTEVLLLFEPEGTEGGASGANFQDTYFDDGGAGVLGLPGYNAAPFAGPEYGGGMRYRVRDASYDLSVFNGLDPNGEWTLTIIDDFNGDSGTLYKVGDAAPWGEALGTQLIITEVPEPSSGTIVAGLASLLVTLLCRRHKRVRGA